MFGKPETAREQSGSSDGSGLEEVRLDPWPAAQRRAIEEVVAEVEHSAKVLLLAIEDLFDALGGMGGVHGLDGVGARRRLRAATRGGGGSTARDEWQSRMLIEHLPVSRDVRS